MFILLSKYTVSSHLHKSWSHEVIISGEKSHIPTVWILCREILCPTCTLPRFQEWFHLPALLFLSTDSSQIHMPIPEGMQQEVQWFCYGKKAQEDAGEREKKRLKGMCSKCWNLLAFIHSPDYLDYFSLFFFPFFFSVPFAKTKITVLKTYLSA